MVNGSLDEEETAGSVSTAIKFVADVVASVIWSRWDVRQTSAKLADGNKSVTVAIHRTTKREQPSDMTAILIKE